MSPLASRSCLPERRRPPVSRPTLLALSTGLAMVALGLAPASEVAAQVSFGLSSVRVQTFDNEDFGNYLPERGDRFAAELATGDFNGDGADDLATGIPNDNGPAAAPIENMGAVVVRFGIPGSGLAPPPATVILHQPMSGGFDNAAPSEFFGVTLAAGDFDHDGFDDLAVGISGDHGTVLAAEGFAGAVQIFYGNGEGIASVPDETLVPGQQGIPGAEASGEAFGAALAVGRFDADSHDDLAIGSPRYVTFPAALERGGAVLIANGSAEGLLPFDGGLFFQDSPGIPDDSEDSDYFGGALATGDFDGNGFDDLAIGVPNENQTGAVLVLFASSSGLVYADHVWWREDDLGGVSELGDSFGEKLVAGDFDGDGFDELVVGAPFEDLGTGNEIEDAGEVTLLYGSGAGAPSWFDLGRTGHWRQSDIYLDPGSDQATDGFGSALASADFDRDGRDDLVIGHWGEDLGGTDRGAVTLLMGAAGTGIWGGAKLLVTGSGLPGDPQDRQELGFALAVGDFDGDGHPDLAIGVPRRDAAEMDVGQENVLYGSLFSDGFVSGDWSGGWADLP